MPAANRTARAMYTADQIADSRKVGACGVLMCPKKSKTIRPSTPAIVAAQTQVGTPICRYLRYVAMSTGGLLRPIATQQRQDQGYRADVRPAAPRQPCSKSAVRHVSP